MEGLGIDWAALWEAGGFLAVAVVFLGISLLILVARWDKRTGEKQDPVVAEVKALAAKVEVMALHSERRLTIAETRLDDHQRQLDRLDRRTE